MWWLGVFSYCVPWCPVGSHTCLGHLQGVLPRPSIWGKCAKIKASNCEIPWFSSFRPLVLSHSLFYGKHIEQSLRCAPEARWAEWFKSRYSTLMNLMNQRTNESNERLAKFQTRWSDIPQIPRLVRSALARGATWSGGRISKLCDTDALQTCDDSTLLTPRIGCLNQTACTSMWARV